MAVSSASGRINFYQLPIRRLKGCPIAQICIHTSRSSLKENYATLSILNEFKTVRALEHLQIFVNEDLKHLGVRLVTWRIHSEYQRKILDNRVNIDDPIPTHIKISDLSCVKALLQELLVNCQTYQIDSRHAQDLLDELDRSVRFTKRVEKISSRQLGYLKRLLSSHAQNIREEAPDSQTATEWLKHTAKRLKISGPKSRQNLHNGLWTAFQSGHDKSEQFYESLFAFAKVYASIDNLEEELARLGKGIPSQEIIQRVVMNFLISPANSRPFLDPSFVVAFPL